MEGWLSYGSFFLVFAFTYAIVVLGHNGYPARNEHLFAATLGADLHYFWMPPDEWDPSGPVKKERLTTFSVDLSVYGEQLGAVLDGV